MGSTSFLVWQFCRPSSWFSIAIDTSTLVPKTSECLFLSEAFHSLLFKRNVYIFNHNRVKVLALSLFIRHKFMLIKARHRNAREKIKFLKLVAFDDVIGFSRVNHGFYLVRIGDDIQQKCCSRTYKRAKLNLLNKTW